MTTPQKPIPLSEREPDFLPCWLFGKPLQTHPVPVAHWRHSNDVRNSAKYFITSPFIPSHWLPDSPTAPEVVPETEKCPVCGGDEPCSHNFDAIKWPDQASRTPASKTGTPRSNAIELQVGKWLARYAGHSFTLPEVANQIHEEFEAVRQLERELAEAKAKLATTNIRFAAFEAGQKEARVSRPTAEQIEACVNDLIATAVGWVRGENDFSGKTVTAILTRHFNPEKK